MENPTKRVEKHIKNHQWVPSGIRHHNYSTLYHKGATVTMISKVRNDNDGSNLTRQGQNLTTQPQHKWCKNKKQQYKKGDKQEPKTICHQHGCKQS